MRFLRPTRIKIPLIILILLIASATRFHALGAQSLWNDEGSSVAQAGRTFSEIAVNAAADIHPPGYYWGLKVWTLAAGESEFALRYFSALAGVLTVAFVVALGLRLHPNRDGMGVVVGVVAALLVSLNTFQIYYSQEARMYAALVLWGVASVWALVGFCNRPTLPRGVILGIVNALGLWTQYAFPLVMLAQLAAAAVWLIDILRRRGSRIAWAGAWRYAAANLLAIALFAPMLQTALRQVTNWPNTGDAAVPLVEAGAALLRWYAFGVTHPEIDVSWLAVALILLIFGLHTQGTDYRWQRVTPLALFAIPTLIFLSMGLYREGNIKFLLPSSVGFALMIGQGVAVMAWLPDLPMMAHTSDAATMRATYAQRIRQRSRPRTAARLAAIAGVVGLTVVLIRALPPIYSIDYARNDYRAIVEAITHDTGDYAVILNAPGQGEVFDYYDGGRSVVLRIPAGINSSDDDIRENTLNATRFYDRLYLVLWGDAERDPNRIVETTLNETVYPLDSTWYGDVRLVQYVTEPDWFNAVTYPRATFGEHITLEQVTLARSTHPPGGAVPVKLTWTTDAPLDENYRVFVQLLDENGALVVGRDGAPVGWTRPTSTWGGGEEIIDRHALLLPQDMEASNLSLIVGLYNPDNNGARLSVNNEADTYLEIASITITEG